MADMGGSGMWGGLIQSGVGMVGSIYGAIHANKNKKEISALEKNMPTYTRPEEVKQMLELAKNNAGSRQLPGQGQMEQNIQQAGQSGLRNIQNMSDNPTSSLGAANDLYKSEMNAYNNLAVQQQQYYQTNQDRLSQALNESAKYSDMEFEYNKNAPWQRQMQSKINEWSSNRSLMQQGGAVAANGAGNMNFSSWYGNGNNGGNNSGINTGQIQSDTSAALNSGQGVDYNANDNSSYKTTG
jgi:hypothetical protein